MVSGMEAGIRRETFSAGGADCVSYGRGAPEVLLLQPVDRRDGEADREAEAVAAGTDVPFLLVTFAVEDWDRDLSPWPAPPVFGKEPFGGGADATLSLLTEEILPAVRERARADGAPAILGGYSLAGLFSLWAAYETDAFAAAAAVSPSVWFEGWTDFARVRAPKAGFVYLSLGDAEEKARNRTLAAVGDRIREQHGILLGQAVSCDLEWNAGNHFADPDGRTAKGFLRCVRALCGRGGEDGA